ncbi:hypothetical protein M433DRAFT_146124 [Acidomyces richmondensis BFW]|nr:MAG: hypothetical protein FE78DRAFT_83000 [Acidomyces sp. 'richmondensis']KYG43176.1 hypothetical protein M433DRAFT_146124 [Acidomyces richmondensis BFW]
MAESYSKRKNEELIALCKERGLPHNGKKADFVKRLEDYDAKQTSSTAANPPIEDEIDWDDEPATEAAKSAATEPAAEALKAGGVGNVNNPVAVPNQELAEEPGKTDDLAVAATGESAPNGEAKPAQAEKEKATEKDYSSGMAELTLEEEIEKRKARARKFGLPENSDDIKLLERMKRFGVVEGSGALALLNKALPGAREKKRGMEGDSDGGVKKRGRRGGLRGRGASRREGSGRRGASREPEKSQRNGSGVWMTAEDRAKAEARKKRFATTTE